MIEESLKELILNLVEVDGNDFPMIDGEDAVERGRKRMKIVSADTDRLKSSMKILQHFVMDKVDFCVYVVFQMAVVTYLKRKLYQAGDGDTEDVNDLFSNINLGQAFMLHCSCFENRG